MSSSKLQQAAVTGVFWSFIQNGGTQVINLILFVVLARLLGPESFGLIALAQSFIMFGSALLSQGLGSAIVQRENLEKAHLDTAFWFQVLIATTVALVALFGASFVAALYDQPILAPIVGWLSLTLIANSLNEVQQALLTRAFAFRYHAVRQLISISSGGVVAISMAFLGYGVWSLVGQQLVTGIVGVVVLWRISAWRPGLNVSFRHLKELFSFGSYLWGVNLLTFVYRRADTLIIGYFLGPVALGFYNIAYNVLLALNTMFTQTLYSVTLPLFSRLQDDVPRLREGFYQVTKLSSLAAFPTFTGIALLAPEIVLGFFGAQWSQSTPIIQVLAFFGLLNSVQFFNNSVIQAVGKPAWALALTALDALAIIATSLIFVHFGILAVACAYTVRGYLFSPASVWVLRRLVAIEIAPFLRQFITPFVSCFLMSAAVFSLRQVTSLAPIPAVLLYSLVGAFTYIAAVLLIEPSLYNRISSLLHLLSRNRDNPQKQV